ncbi:MAG: hypothetical protein ACTHMX_16905 [Thermomicrobiales bacterium]|jgi:hypothetical protein
MPYQAITGRSSHCEGRIDGIADIANGGYAPGFPARCQPGLRPSLRVYVG